MSPSVSTSKRHALLLVIISICLTSTLRGQDHAVSPFRFKGFVDTYHAVRSTSPFDFMSSRTRVRAEAEKQFGNSRLAVSVNISYNALLNEESGLRLREAYFEHRQAHWGLRLGRQIAIWGTADGVRITDLLSPMDMTEFLAQDYDDIRMPVNALRFFLFNETMKFEVVLIPTFEGYRLPTNKNNPWSIFAPPNHPNMHIIWDDSQGKPSLRAANIEYGGRWSVTLPGIDFSVAALHTWNKKPVIEQKLLSPTEVVISPHYYRMGFFGGDVSIPTGAFVLRGEAAFNIGKHFTFKKQAKQESFNTLNWLVGADWYAPNEWMLSGQFSMENIFNYKDLISQKNNAALLTLNISKKLLDSTLQLSDFTYYDLTGKGWFSRLAADYALSDQIHLLTGYDWFGSHGESLFSPYQDNSEVWFKARYSF